MKNVSIDEAINNLSGYLQIAQKEYVIITKNGLPAGILIGIEESEDWWEELLLREPHFQERVARARQSLREGKGISIEQLREKYEI
jgi:prevent-host-death family protein